MWAQHGAAFGSYLSNRTLSSIFFALGVEVDCLLVGDCKTKWIK